MAIASLNTLWHTEARGQVYVRVTRWAPEALALRLAADASVCLSSVAPDTVPALVSRSDRLCAKADVLATWPMLSARFCAGVRLGLQPTGRNDGPTADGSSILKVAVAL